MESTSVRISPNIAKRLRVLQRGGGNAAQAARHARTIINQVLDGVFSPKDMGRLTRYGEARIANCFKFDLVGGYRLIATSSNREICFLYVGSHDECDHWIKNNAGLESLPESARAETIPVSCEDVGEDPDGPDEEEELEPEPEYDPAVLRDVTETDLRKIFCGLVKR
jgi:hypothetical protein